MNPSVLSLAACSTSKKSSTSLSEFLLVSPLLSLRTFTAPAFAPSSAFLIREAARCDGLETVRLLLEEVALNPFGDDGLFSLFNDRFLDALTLSLRRAIKSRPGVSLGLLSFSL
ncbi:Os04g0603100 [Oryza sativa Japonica Group]|uniref:Os04g0603100 protein n=1 Tax=Oryza sativa subsp. japonica TaxID=39947 RepID=Q0JAE3_ORYSJ|nr:Os04g0603100 [Oryza sativa Japonica Group]|eukprot:NP_001053780.1 Os04g0603100 [Oryza sativa Japonica Group]